jgi:hypothetical protein
VHNGRTILTPCGDCIRCRGQIFRVVRGERQITHIPPRPNRKRAHVDRHLRLRNSAQHALLRAYAVLQLIENCASSPVSIFAAAE